MWILINIASDWIIMIVAMIHLWIFWWITSTATQRLLATENSTAAIMTVRRNLNNLLSLTLASTPLVFAASICFAKWPPSRFTLFLIMICALNTLYRIILPLIIRSFAFSIDSHTDFLMWHRMHFSLVEELLQDPAISEATKANIRRRQEELAEAAEVKEASRKGKK